MLESATRRFQEHAGFEDRGWPPILLEDKLPEPVHELVGEAWSGVWDDLINADAEAVRNGASSILSGLVDNILGVYRPSAEEITLYPRTIKSFAASKALAYEAVFSVVLVHEFGHWITHKLPHAESVEWCQPGYNLAPPHIHEGWAELIALWEAKSSDNENLTKAHDKLNEGLPASSPYLYHQHLIFSFGLNCS